MKIYSKPFLFFFLGPRICFSEFENVFQNCYFRKMEIESDRFRCILNIKKTPRLQIRENRKNIRSRYVRRSVVLKYMGYQIRLVKLWVQHLILIFSCSYTYEMRYSKTERDHNILVFGHRRTDKRKSSKSKQNNWCASLRRLQNKNSRISGPDQKFWSMDRTNFFGPWISQSVTVYRYIYIFRRTVAKEVEKILRFRIKPNRRIFWTWKRCMTMIVPIGQRYYQKDR